MCEIVLLLADANILLDLAHLQRLSLLECIVQSLGWRIAVPYRVVREVAAEISADTLVGYGVELLPLSMQMEFALAEELALRRLSSEALSETDVELLLRGHTQDVVIWSGDQCLKRCAENCGVRVMQFFEPLVELYRAEVFARDFVLGLARRLVQDNPWGFPKDLVQRLERLLKR